MEMTSNLNKSEYLKIELVEGGKKLGRVYLYFVKNDLHEQPYGLMEDLFIDPSLRGQGLGTSLINEVIKAAKQHNCYKLIATSRMANESVHRLYDKLDFKRHGIEYRMELLDINSSCTL